MLLRFLLSLKQHRLKLPLSNIMDVLRMADLHTEACTSVQAIPPHQGQPTVHLPIALGPPMVHPLMEHPSLHTERPGLDNIVHLLLHHLMRVVANRPDIVHPLALVIVHPLALAIVRPLALAIVRPLALAIVRLHQERTLGIDLPQLLRLQDIDHRQPLGTAHRQLRPLGTAHRQLRPLVIAHLHRNQTLDIDLQLLLQPLSLRSHSQELSLPPQSLRLILTICLLRV